jgi:hypothetical protein
MVLQGGAVREAIDGLRARCSEGDWLPPIYWEQLRMVAEEKELNSTWPEAANNLGRALLNWSVAIYQSKCEIQLTRNGTPVFVLEGDDPDGPDATAHDTQSFKDIIKRAANPNSEFDEAVVELVIEWVEQGPKGKGRDAYTELSTAVRHERKFRDLAAKLVSDYRGPIDNQRVAALVCKHGNLQPNVFREMTAEDRIPFLEVAIDASPTTTPRDTKDKTDPKMPDNPDVRDLCHLLGKNQEKISKGDTSEIGVAREFTSGNDKKAASLLRQARRFPHLWRRADN